MISRIVKFEGDHKADIVRIRTQVFVDEQEIDSKIDFDGLDEVATQSLVYVQDKAIATGRLLDDGHIGRIAVLKSNRGSGAGTAILRLLIAEAKKRDYSRVYLGSQVHALGFYKNLGFETCSEIFIDAGIEHIEMELLL